MKLLANILVVTMLLLAGARIVEAQANPRTQKPVKNPPQYPNIIDLENKGTTARKPEGSTVTEETAPPLSAALVRAVESLASEVRTLVQEMRALNVRQQAQIDMLRLTRGDLRIDSYDRELRSVTDRFLQLERDEQALRAAITPEGLVAQVGRMGTVDREETMRQIKRDLEIRLNALLPEKERLRTRKDELEGIVNGFRDTNEKTERRILLIEEALRQIAAPAAAPGRKPED